MERRTWQSACSRHAAATFETGCFALADHPVETAERKAALLCVEALVNDFGNYWWDGKSVTMYREGKRRHPQRFRLV